MGIDLGSRQAWDMGEVDARPVVRQEPDADRCEVVSGSGLLGRVPRHLKVKLAPLIAGYISEVKDRARPAIMVCNNMSAVGLTLRSFRSLITGRRENALNFRHADFRALSRTVIEQERSGFTCPGSGCRPTVDEDRLRFELGIKP